VAGNAMDMLGRSRKDVVAATIPCLGTSKRTKSNAEKMCELLGVDLRVIDISETVKRHLADIGHDGVTPDVTFENAQARERTQVLMDISNMENGLVLGTGDLSEGALGWCTFNGDHISMYNVNGDMPKTFIRAVVKHVADTWGDEALRDVLYDVVATPISPELTPAVNGEIAQKTEDIVGPYDAHDFFIYHFIRNGSGPKKILRVAEQAFEGIYTPEQLKGWLRTFFRRFFNSQFKRNCVPDCPEIGSVDLSPYSWRMTSDASSAAFLAELED
ncbi:MAG: NAD(+) synthase, partial [Oscillospiraceae bacterium]|nr:NAD(+) synthase [Oscillospiraceae bacterium]